MQRRSLLFEIHFNDFFCIVPSATRVSHEDRLVETENRNRDQVPDKVEGFNEREGKSGKENCEKDVEHAFLCILRANLHDLLTVSNRSLCDPFQLYIRLDELDRPICSRGYRLRRCACEPVDHRPTSN